MISVNRLTGKEESEIGEQEINVQPGSVGHRHDTSQPGNAFHDPAVMDGIVVVSLLRKERRPRGEKGDEVPLSEKGRGFESQECGACRESGRQTLSSNPAAPASVWKPCGFAADSIQSHRRIAPAASTSRRGV